MATLDPGPTTNPPEDRPQEEPPRRSASLRTGARATLLFGAIGVLAGLQFWANSVLEGSRLDLLAVLARHVPSWLSWGLLTPALWALARRWPLRGDGWRRSGALHVAVSVGIAVVHRPLHVWFAWYPFWGNGPAWDFTRDFAFFSLFTDVAIYWMILGARTLHEHRELLRLRDLRTASLRGELAQARLTALEQQLRPHFLFNTLHAIPALLEDGRHEEAARMVQQLAELLRAVLDRDAPSELPLRDELRLVDPYLRLMALRLEGRARVEIEPTPEAADGLVPRLILQPVLENAFLHGLEARSGAELLRIRAWVEEDALIIEVLDDGPGVGDSSGPGGQGIGLDNVRRRLEASYASGAEFELSPREGAPGTAARLRLPYRVDIGERT